MSALHSQDPRAPAWGELLQARSPEAAQTWLKTELMIALHHGKVSAQTVTEIMAHFGLKSA